MTWQPVLLIGAAGFLLGGVGGLWKTSRVAAGVCGVMAAACLVGAVLWFTT